MKLIAMESFVDETSRYRRARRRLRIAAALVLIGVPVALISRLVHRPAREVGCSWNLVPVLVANKNIPAGHVLTREDVFGRR